MAVAAQNADVAVDPRGESTRMRILDSAEHLFSERGVNGASLRTIVAHAGVNTAAVHYHFGSKNGLLEAVFARRTVPIAEERRHLDCGGGTGWFAQAQGFYPVVLGKPAIIPIYIG